LAHIQEGERDKRHVMRTECGTRGYMAPEILEGQPYGYESDIFAAGVILFIMLAGFPPFQYATAQDWWFQKLQTGRHSLFWKAHTRQAFFSEDAKDFINKILEPNPAERITLSQILEHPWFTASVLSDSELRDELSNRKRTVSAQKKKEREALARKNARGSGRVRGQDQPKDRSIDFLGSDGLPISVPEMEFSFGANGPVAVEVPAALGILGSPRVVAPAPVFDEKNNVECYTSFQSSLEPMQMSTMLCDLLQSANVRFSKQSAYELRATIMFRDSGSIDFAIRIYTTATEVPLTVVQFRRLKGDVLQFHTLFDELLTELADVIYIPDDVEEVQ